MGVDALDRAAGGDRDRAGVEAGDGVDDALVDHVAGVEGEQPGAGAGEGGEVQRRAVGAGDGRGIGHQGDLQRQAEALGVQHLQAGAAGGGLDLGLVGDPAGAGVAPVMPPCG